MDGGLISVGGKAHIAFVVVRRHPNDDNNFYLHEVGLLDDIKKEAERLDDTGLSPDGAKVARPLGSLRSLAESFFVVNEASKVVERVGIDPSRHDCFRLVFGGLAE